MEQKTFFSQSDSMLIARGKPGVVWCAWDALYGGLSAAKYRLENGLTVVLMPDLRAPVFSYQTWYRVGSKHEDPGCTGLAHFFEHLMFKGTHTYPAGTFDRAMEVRGAQTNAATWVDWTFYTQSLSADSDHFETVLAFESDRMTQLNVTQDVFLSELEVVKNERRLTVEDSPSGRVAEKIAAMAYPSHGYGRPTIGFMEHLNAMKLEQAYAFYRTFYTPNQASVVVCGALDPDVALSSIVRFYGGISTEGRSAGWPATASAHDPLYGPAGYDVFESDVVQTHMTVAYPAPAQNTPEYVLAEVLSDILLEGDSGRLYQSLVVEKRIVAEVSGGITPYAEPGLIEFHMVLREGVSPKKALKALQGALDALQKGLASYELNKARHALEWSFLEQWGETETAAEALGHHETCFGDFSIAFKSLEKHAGVTEKAVKHMAASLFDPSRRYVVAAVPVGQRGLV